MNLHELGQRIRAQREKCGLKQNDVAGALQVSPQAVSKWERGENAPDIAQLVPLGGLLGVSVDWLLGSFVEDRDVFEATVLCSGVKGAREQSEAMTPRQFAEWTNAVCFQITEAVLRHDAVPIKYVGPGLLCFFSGPNHRRRALSASLHAKSTSNVQLKIGICTGQVYFGSVGHPDYSRPDIMGEVVSIALLSTDWAASNTESGIVACSKTVEGPLDSFSIGKEHPVSFPGISHEVSLFEIKD